MPILLIVAAVAQIVLTVVQWFELVFAEAGGGTFCSVSDTIDCATVWGAPIAKQIQQLTAVPVAGWGLVWALGAFAAAMWHVQRRLAGDAGAAPAQVARVFAVAGLGGVVLFAGVSLSLGALCLTCLGTYVLTGLYAVAAFRLAAPRAPWGRAAVTAAALVGVGYVLVLYPGVRTRPIALADMGAAAKKAEGAPTAPPKVDGRKPTEARAPVARFLAELDGRTKQAIADGLAEAKASPTPDVSGFAPRPRHFGPEGAAVQLVDFSDIRCGHCASFAMASSELHRLAPPGTLSQVSRWFPLDAECNPKMAPNMTDGSGVRCAGAKTMICLEGKEGYEAARLKIFAAQRSLTLEKINEIATQTGGLSAEALEACLEADATERKLLEDIEYATKYGLEGTPMVLVNGRRVPAIPPLLYAIILAGGDLEHPAFGALPPGQIRGHEGHGH